MELMIPRRCLGRSSKTRCPGSVDIVALRPCDMRFVPVATTVGGPPWVRSEACDLGRTCPTFLWSWVPRPAEPAVSAALFVWPIAAALPVDISVLRSGGPWCGVAPLPPRRGGPALALASAWPPLACGGDCGLDAAPCPAAARRPPPSAPSVPSLLARASPSSAVPPSPWVVELLGTCDQSKRPSLMKPSRMKRSLKRRRR
mmetsp:Transcript_8774/g.24368  ORF Transcript_8774/g.24368 Transcript_8774/m.24368 type:complete len:201 (+) Transcript_8774:332-934(+)